MGDLASGITFAPVHPLDTAVGVLTAPAVIPFQLGESIGEFALDPNLSSGLDIAENGLMLAGIFESGSALQNRFPTFRNLSVKASASALLDTSVPGRLAPNGGWTPWANGNYIKFDPTYFGVMQYVWRNLRVKFTASRLGLASSKAYYVHGLDAYKGGAYFQRFIGNQLIEEAIVIDRFSFDKSYILGTGGVNLNSVVAHEIGHLAPPGPMIWAKPIEFSLEFWADYNGSLLPGLSRTERNGLLKRAFSR